MSTTTGTPRKSKSTIRKHIEALERSPSTPVRFDVSTSEKRTSQSPSAPRQPDTNNPRIKLLTAAEVQEMLGVKRTFLTEHVASKTMPLPIKLGTSRRASIRFFEHEIHKYLMDLAAQREWPTPQTSEVTHLATLPRD